MARVGRPTPTTLACPNKSDRADAPNIATRQAPAISSPGNEVEVCARACIAYEEALVNAFSTLGWSMPTSALQPMGIALGLHYFERFGGRSPGLTVVRIPMALMAELAPPVQT